MRRGFSGYSKKEPADSHTIRKSTREVSIDTLQAAAIDSVNQESIDSNTMLSIDITCEKAENVEGSVIFNVIVVAEMNDFNLSRE
ncbi:hypothetical protein DY000_02039675 [Brassica cretica]|uniref:Uncharacterized protein n=1 Tax=Brassica cretica TaxID=69181 RepID=A0ABQ7BLW7_BRACR|nr:hypothetical protein DY000_02039675 [Brassica cretica]